MHYRTQCDTAPGCAGASLWRRSRRRRAKRPQRARSCRPPRVPGEGRAAGRAGTAPPRCPALGASAGRGGASSDTLKVSGRRRAAGEAEPSGRCCTCFTAASAGAPGPPGAAPFPRPRRGRTGPGRPPGRALRPTAGVARRLLAAAAGGERPLPGRWRAAASACCSSVTWGS